MNYSYKVRVATKIVMAVPENLVVGIPIMPIIINFAILWWVGTTNFKVSVILNRDILNMRFFLIQPLNCILLTGRDKVSFGCNLSVFGHKFEHILT